MRDIGYHFPDSDDKYSGADSKVLLKSVMQKIKEGGYSVGNVDINISLEKPKFKKHISEMQNCIASVMEVDEDSVSV